MDDDQTTQIFTYSVSLLIRKASPVSERIATVKYEAWWKSAAPIDKLVSNIFNQLSQASNRLGMASQAAPSRRKNLDPRSSCFHATLYQTADLNHSTKDKYSNFTCAMVRRTSFWAKCEQGRRFGTIFMVMVYFPDSFHPQRRDPASYRSISTHNCVRLFRIPSQHENW